MTLPGSPWNVADSAMEKARRADAEVRISDFLLFATIPFRSLTAVGLPLNELASLAIVALAASRNPGNSRLLRPTVLVLCAGVLVLLLYSGLTNGVDWTRRVGHVAIWCGLIWATATGRVSLRSAALGLGAGLVSVIGLAGVGIGGDTYAGRLTGFLGDPNAGAYFIVVLGVLAVGFGDHRLKVRLLLALPIVAGLVLTYSRTGLLALGFVLAWAAVGRRLGVYGGAAAVGALVWLVGNIPDDLKLFGPFSNRSGSDALRERIIAREHELLAQAPWYGNGPGTAKVDLADRTMFFHNSYLALRQEGGWPLLVLVVALLAIAFVAVSTLARPHDLAAVGAQAALIGTVVMAVTLGEVLLDLPAALAVGFALGHARHLVLSGSVEPIPLRRGTPPERIQLPRSGRPDEGKPA